MKRLVSMLALGTTATLAASLLLTTSPAGHGVAQAKSLGDVAAGKKIFTANCTTCHGATGKEGGVGPSLKGEKKRKNFAQAVAWIKNPNPPMPKLYPAVLKAKDVNNVAAYVESL